MKDTYEEISNKRCDFDHLRDESAILASWSSNRLNTVEKLNKAEAEWQSLLDKCSKQRELLEKEIAECSLYHQGLQEVEKWVLQMSFQLMAQNSLYITNKAQTEEQIVQHVALLQEILKLVTSFRGKSIFLRSRSSRRIFFCIAVTKKLSTM